MTKIYNSITELVGKTPLVKLSRLAKKHKIKAHILAKCEFYNPAFSVKDRVALKMIEAAEKSGKVCCWDSLLMRLIPMHTVSAPVLKFLKTPAGRSMFWFRRSELPGR